MIRHFPLSLCVSQIVFYETFQAIYGILEIYETFRFYYVTFTLLFSVIKYIQCDQVIVLFISTFSVILVTVHNSHQCCGAGGAEII